MFGLIVMRTVDSLPANVRLLTIAVAVALVVPVVASHIVTLPWRQRAIASVAFSLALLALCFVVAAPAAAKVKAAILIECGCEWINWLCCLV